MFKYCGNSYVQRISLLIQSDRLVLKVISQLLIIWFGFCFFPFIHSYLIILLYSETESSLLWTSLMQLF